MNANIIELLTLAQLSQGQDWRVHLCHDRPANILIWITRGQGLLQLDGQRRGLGAHNAVFIPAGALFALDLGRQGIGQVVVIPEGSELRLPQMPRHLRIRDVQAQTEFTGLIEAAQREQQTKRPLFHDALEAQAALMSVWLRRQILQDEHIPSRPNAGSRLSARFCQLVSERYRSGAPMSHYAETLEVTPTHLSRAVKSATGRTAADILTERVLHEARHLLGSTQHPAQDIARHLGFGSAAYFTRFIQKHTGSTPSRLRVATA
ncbi:AraC family transcriptional regulator [Sulfitobacter sp. BSw21498]|uniref:AraC family transcriptional regulator n=1 Tax=Sulfitobacter sp. BSw21498 TaxID=664426 RepID=UPI001110D752|nr:AraC family transcriptional regulator [Sulfitobacter sp. BSw21498]